MLSLSLPTGCSLFLSDTGRLTTVHGSQRVPVLTGAHLYDVISTRIAFRTDLRQLLDYITIALEPEPGRRRPSKQTRHHLHVSRDIVQSAILAMQGTPGDWAASVALELPPLPSWARSELLRPSPLNTVLRTCYRHGFTAQEAADAVLRAVRNDNRSATMSEQPVAVREVA